MVDKETKLAAAVMALAYAAVDLTDELHLFRLELQDSAKRSGGLKAALRSSKSAPAPTGPGRKT